MEKKEAIEFLRTLESEDLIKIIENITSDKFKVNKLKALANVSGIEVQ